MVGMLLMLAALLVIPFVDLSDHEPGSAAEAFNLRRRGWAFLAMGVFWMVMVVGMMQNFVTMPD